MFLLSAHEVINRWGQIYNVLEIVQNYQAGGGSEYERDIVSAFIEKWRKRLMDINWFMKVMNYNIAVKANKEDDCKGKLYNRHPWLLPFGPAALFKFVPDEFVEIPI